MPAGRSRSERVETDELSNEELLTLLNVEAGRLEATLPPLVESLHARGLLAWGWDISEKIMGPTWSLSEQGHVVLASAMVSHVAVRSGTGEAITVLRADWMQR